MFVKIKTEKTQHFRKSKLGKEHTYFRNKTVVCLKCDECDILFERDLKHIDRKRMSNNYFHCCSYCDAKKFAQKKSVERKKIWDMPASTDLPVAKH